MRTAWSVTVQSRDRKLDSLTCAILTGGGRNAPDEAGEAETD